MGAQTGVETTLTAIDHAVEVAAPVEVVFDTFTTRAGVNSFFGRDAWIEPRRGGAYEIYFLPEGSPERGSDGARILAFEPPHFLRFTWNAPPKFPSVREQHTVVDVTFSRLAQRRTAVRLLQYGWRDGEEWEQVRRYFDAAWPQVLDGLRERFAGRPELRAYRIGLSTNCERVALALGHKRLVCEWVDVPPDDRSAVVAASGQELVPVLVCGDDTVADSMRILRLLEERFPQPPLLPPDPGGRARVEVFCDWFEGVWKPASGVVANDEAAPEQRERATGLLRDSVSRLDGLLQGQDYLFGAFSLADVVAFPFVKLGLGLEPGDDYAYHRVLSEHLPVAGHPAVRAWVERVDRHARG